jgi:hypothetical protein
LLRRPIKIHVLFQPIKGDFHCDKFLANAPSEYAAPTELESLTAMLLQRCRS